MTLAVWLSVSLTLVSVRVNWCHFYVTGMQVVRMHPAWAACMWGGHSHNAKDVEKLCRVVALARISIVTPLQGERNNARLV